MRIVIDEDIPSELAPLFGGPDLDVQHVEEIGLKGTKNGELLTALSGACDVFVTSDTNLGHQLNLAKYDVAIVLLHPGRLVLDQIKPFQATGAQGVLEAAMKVTGSIPTNAKFTPMWRGRPPGSDTHTDLRRVSLSPPRRTRRGAAR